MDVVAKIVFIDEQRLLIMEMSPVAEVNPFLNGILFNLTLDNVSNEQPIKMTCEGKNRVVDFLGRNNSDYLQKARKYGHFTGYKN